MKTIGEAFQADFLSPIKNIEFDLAERRYDAATKDTLSFLIDTSLNGIVSTELGPAGLEVLILLTNHVLANKVVELIY